MPAPGRVQRYWRARRLPGVIPKKPVGDPAPSRSNSIPILTMFAVVQNRLVALVQVVAFQHLQLQGYVRSSSGYLGRNRINTSPLSIRARAIRAWRP